MQQKTIYQHNLYEIMEMGKTLDFATSRLEFEQSQIDSPSFISGHQYCDNSARIFRWKNDNINSSKEVCLLNVLIAMSCKKKSNVN